MSEAINLLHNDPSSCTSQGYCKVEVVSLVHVVRRSLLQKSNFREDLTDRSVQKEAGRCICGTGRRWPQIYRWHVLDRTIKSNPNRGNP